MINATRNSGEFRYYSELLRTKMSALTTATASPATPDAARKGMPVAGWVLLFLPVALLILKHFGPQAEWLNHALSLESLTPVMQKKAAHILFMPLAAVFVVFFRLSLGIRVLGPFRAILLAWAFTSTGVWIGAILVVITVAAMVTIRKPVSKLKLPYFARISVMLSAVAVLITLFLLMGSWTGAEWLQSIARLPVIVLCLISEAFVEVLRKEGYASAVWRMFTTTVLGMLITLLAMSHDARNFLVANPELVLFQIGVIIVIARFAKWKLFDKWNPGSAGDTDEEDAADKLLTRKPRPASAAVPTASVSTPPVVELPTASGSPIAAA